MKTTPKKDNLLSFVIVNYKSTKELRTCLAHLSAIEHAETFSIIVVNNDKKRLMLPQHDFAQQEIIEINKNIGYGAANNRGLSYVKTPFVCFLNPDTHTFCKNLLDITSEFTHQDMIISPRIYTETAQLEPWSVGTKITLFQLIKNHLGFYKKPWLSQKKIIVDWVSGAALFSSTQFIKDLGGFDKDFFLYYEDVDLCKRAKTSGGKVYYTPYFHLTHTNGVSSKKNTKIQKRQYYTSQNLFFQKHCSKLQTKLLHLFHFFLT